MPDHPICLVVEGVSAPVEVVVSMTALAAAFVRIISLVAAVVCVAWVTALLRAVGVTPAIVMVSAQFEADYELLEVVVGSE